MATFKGDQMTECSAAAASWTSVLPPATGRDFPPIEPGRLAQAALFFAEGMEKTELTSALERIMAGATMDEHRPRTQKQRDELANNVSGLVTWPPKGKTVLAKAVEKGELVKVDGCDIQGKTAAGTCSIPQQQSADGRLRWTYEKRLFRSADVDAGLKKCLIAGGKWAANQAKTPPTGRKSLLLQMMEKQLQGQ